MNKDLQNQTENVKAGTPLVGKNGIVTFVQMPPSPPPFEKIDRKDKSSLDGIDLFSRFTADIIKEDVIFTR